MQWVESQDNFLSTLGFHFMIIITRLSTFYSLHHLAPFICCNSECHFHLFVQLTTAIRQSNSNKAKGSQTKNVVYAQERIQTNNHSILTSGQEQIDLNLIRPRSGLSYWLGKIPACIYVFRNYFNKRLEPTKIVFEFL